MSSCLRKSVGLIALIAGLSAGASAHAQVLVTDWGAGLNNYNPGTNSISFLAGPLGQPTGMTMGSDGLLYMSNIATNTIDQFNPTTGAFVGNFVSSATLGSSFQPTGMAFVNSDLYISKQAGFPGAPPGSGGVYKYSGGSLTQVVPNLTQAEGLVVVGNNLFIAELNNYTNGGQILEYNLTTQNVSVFVDQTGTPHAPSGMVLGPDGMLYVADITGFEIHRYDPNNAANNSTVVLGGAGLNSPTGVAFYNHDLYVSNFGSGSSADGFLSKYTYDSGTDSYTFAGDVVSNLFAGSAVVAVPEPTSLALFSIPAGVWWLRRRNRN